MYNEEDAFVIILLIDRNGFMDILIISTFILIFLIILLLFSGIWPTFFGAPWVPTKRELIHRMMKLAEVGPADTVYDLGCGDGRILIIAAREYGARAVGVEIEPLKYILCQFLITVLGLRKQVTIHLGNFFNHDLSDATVVVCYLLKDTNKQLLKKFHQELAPGTRVLSNIFTFPKMDPVKEDDTALLYIFNTEH